jgi:hypothetical protein
MSTNFIDGTDFLLEDLVCSICFEYFNSPKTLTCQHTFCNGCIESKFTSVCFVFLVFFIVF